MKYYSHDNANINRPRRQSLQEPKGSLCFGEKDHRGRCAKTLGGISKGRKENKEEITRRERARSIGKDTSDPNPASYIGGSMAITSLSKISPKNPMKTDTPAPVGLQDRLAALIQSLPANHRAGFEQFQKDFALKLEIANWAHVDDVTIALAAAEEIKQISGNLTALVDTLAEMGELADYWQEEKFADMLRPAEQWLKTIISSEWPDTKMIREHIEEMGFEDDIRG
jgi:hypothetical protein